MDPATAPPTQQTEGLSVTEDDVEETLSRSRRCLVVARGEHAPALLPAPFWFDGRALWAVLSGRDDLPASLSRSTTGAVYVGPPGTAGPALVVRGRLRVYSPADPVALTLHGAVVSAALAALTVKQATGAVAAGRGLPGAVRAAGVPWGRAVARVAVERVLRVEAAEPGPGVAPALPGVVPVDVRRALGGRRRVVLATGLEEPRVGPAVWSAGYALTAEASLLGDDGDPAAVHVADDEAGGASSPLGLILEGVLREGALEPRRAWWWRDGAGASAEVAGEAPGAIELPD